MSNNQTFRNYLAAGIVCQSLWPITGDSTTVDHLCSYNGNIAPALPNINIEGYTYVMMRFINEKTYAYFYSKAPDVAIAGIKKYNNVELPTILDVYHHPNALYVLVDDNGTYKYYRVQNVGEYGNFAYDKTNGVFINNSTNSSMVRITIGYTLNASGSGWTYFSMNSTSYAGEVVPISTNVIWATEDIMDTEGNVYIPTSKPISVSYDSAYIYYTLPLSYIVVASNGEYSWGNCSIYRNNTNSGGYYYKISPSGNYWHNHDLITEDGNVLLAASDPIPVYE